MLGQAATESVHNWR